MYGLFTHTFYFTKLEPKWKYKCHNYLDPQHPCMVYLPTCTIELDSNKPLFGRITFFETLAALCKIYPEEVDRRVTGSNKEVRKVLWAATAPDRMEWLFDNLRVRHAMGAPARALMPSGTASNEALHAEIISWGTSIRSLHKSTLRLKLCIMHFGKLLAHHVASCYPGIRQTSEAVLLARALANNVWTENIWQNWCLEQGGRTKAAVPLHRSRQKERQQVREWKATHGKKHTHVQKKTCQKDSTRCSTHAFGSTCRGQIVV